MKAVASSIFKYLAWALLILVALLYFENYDVRTQGLIILVGVIALDIVFNIVGVIRRGVEKRRKKTLAAAKAVKSTSIAVKDTVKSAGDTVKTAGVNVKDSCSSAWQSIKETSTHLTTSIKDKLPASSTPSSALSVTADKNKQD